VLIGFACILDLSWETVFGEKILPNKPLKKMLLIAYCFPPVGGISVAGSQRALKFVKNLRLYQWECTVLTAKEECYEPYIFMDTDLLKRIPSDIKVVRTSVLRFLTKILKLRRKINSKVYKNKSINNVTENEKLICISENKGIYKILKDSITDLFSIPDEEMGWIIPTIFCGVKEIRKEKIDLIYSTGKPWTSHIIGMSLSIITEKPLVVEFRDPWMTNPFREECSMLKNKIEKYLEKKSIEIADLVVSNTFELKEEFINRFPKEKKDKFITVLNGFDSNDYLNKYNEKIRKIHNEFFTITHTGFLYGKRDPINFIKAVKFIIDNNIIEKNKIKIFLIGSVELSYDIEKYIYLNNLKDVVVVEKHVPYEKSLMYLKNSDVLLLLQPGTTTQIPSKLFDYIGMRKPILTISPYGGATHNLIVRESIGRFAPPDDIQEIANVIIAMYEEWNNGFFSDYCNGIAYSKFNIKNITKELSKELLKITR
jgi:glycosyltransferase involved in cell wall biosynthesis